MEIPTLPTDSTYKFAAVLGSIMAVGAMWFFLTSVEQHILERAVYRKREEIIMAQIKDLKESVVEEAKKKVSNHEDIVSLRTANEKNEEELNKLDIDRQMMDVKHKNDKAMRLLLIIFGFPGTVFAWWGFRQWHYKIQLPQDQLIVEQLVVLRLTRQEAMAKADQKRKEQQQQQEQ